jgi:hypothetical protein
VDCRVVALSLSLERKRIPIRLFPAGFSFQRKDLQRLGEGEGQCPPASAFHKQEMSSAIATGEASAQTLVSLMLSVIDGDKSDYIDTGDIKGFMSDWLVCDDISSVFSLISLDNFVCEADKNSDGKVSAT